MTQVATINPLNQYFDQPSGLPLTDGKIYIGEVNKDPEQFPIVVYWDAAGLVPALQPIRTTSGYPTRNGSPAILYVNSLYSMRVRNKGDVQVFYIASTGTAPSVAPTPFVDTGLTPSYASANSFTLTGNQTTEFQPGRRARMTLGSGYVYGSILTAVYGALTTVTMTMDGSSVLDASLSTVALSFFPVTPYALPPTIETVNKQTGTTYTYLAADQGKLVTHTNAAAIAGTLPIASALGAGWWTDVQNRGAGVLTITPTTSTIDGAATLVLQPGQGVRITNDGTNYFAMRGSGTSATSLPMQTFSGSTLTFLNVPAGAKLIHISVRRMSSTGTNTPLLQLGTSAGLVTANYEGTSVNGVAGGATVGVTFGSGFGLSGTSIAAATVHGVITLAMMDAGATPIWSCGLGLGRSDTATVIPGGGTIVLPGVLDRFAFTVGGDTFDNGTVSALCWF